jgi:formyltetrahydrofolate synthetase
MADFDQKAREVQDTVKTTPGLGKSMAKWGALGAVAAIPVPFVGPIFGALAGAGYAYYKGTKKA